MILCGVVEKHERITEERIVRLGYMYILVVEGSSLKKVCVY